MTNNLIGFYEGNATNQVGMSIGDIFDMTDEQLEDDHHYIQWMFPLPEKSLAVPTSPVLTQSDIDIFRNDFGLRGKMLKMVLKMFKFYGVESGKGEKDKGVIMKANNFEKKAKNWLTPHNHNYLRISRMLRSMTILGLEHMAKRLHLCLCGIYEENKGVISPTTKQFWDEAIEREV